MFLVMGKVLKLLHPVSGKCKYNDTVCNMAELSIKPTGKYSYCGFGIPWKVRYTATFSAALIFSVLRSSDRPCYTIALVH